MGVPPTLPLPVQDAEVPSVRPNEIAASLSVSNQTALGLITTGEASASLGGTTASATVTFGMTLAGMISAQAMNRTVVPTSTILRTDTMTTKVRLWLLPCVHEPNERYVARSSMARSLAGTEFAPESMSFEPRDACWDVYQAAARRLHPDLRHVLVHVERLEGKSLTQRHLLTKDFW